MKKKPNHYKNRWPEGKIVMAEGKNIFDDNIAYPADFDPENQTFDPEQALYEFPASFIKRTKWVWVLII